MRKITTNGETGGTERLGSVVNGVDYVFTVQRKMKRTKWEYHIHNDGGLRGEAKYTFAILPRKISVFADNGDTLTLNQKNWLLSALRGIPGLKYFIFPPYTYAVNGTVHGRATWSWLSADFFLNNDRYEMRKHSNLATSLMKNNTQVALFRKSKITYFERNEYTVLYDDEMKNSIPMLFLLCIAQDIMFSQNLGGGLSLMKYEKDWIVRDHFSERAKWTPPSADKENPS